MERMQQLSTEQGVKPGLCGPTSSFPQCKLEAAPSLLGGSLGKVAWAQSGKDSKCLVISGEGRGVKEMMGSQQQQEVRMEAMLSQVGRCYSWQIS